MRSFFILCRLLPIFLRKAWVDPNIEPNQYLTIINYVRSFEFFVHQSWKVHLIIMVGLQNARDWERKYTEYDIWNIPTRLCSRFLWWEKQLLYLCCWNPWVLSSTCRSTSWQSFHQLLVLWWLCWTNCWCKQILWKGTYRCTSFTNDVCAPIYLSNYII